MGLGVLGLAPSSFWAMTPKELEAAIRGRFGNVACDTPLSRNELGDLMQRFPDASPS